MKNTISRFKNFGKEINVEINGHHRIKQQTLQEEKKM